LGKRIVKKQKKERGMKNEKKEIKNNARLRRSVKASCRIAYSSQINTISKESDIVEHEKVAFVADNAKSVRKAKKKHSAAIAYHCSQKARVKKRSRFLVEAQSSEETVKTSVDILKELKGGE